MNRNNHSTPDEGGEGEREQNLMRETICLLDKCQSNHKNRTIIGDIYCRQTIQKQI